jgi:hypothetical protein
MLKIFLVLGCSLGLPGPLSAQWAPYPTANVPRTAAGQPDLSAPPPRTQDGRPDLSGMWEVARPTGGGAFGGGSAPVPGPPAPGTNQFWDINTGLAEPVPMREWARALRQKRMADDSKDNPDARCLPMGLMQLHTHPQPRKIIQTSAVVVILYEGNSGIRQIFTDGRPLPADPQPWWYGYSTGRWESDTLVVESAGFVDGGWLDVNGTPLTEKGRLTERFRRSNYGTLEIDVTVDDSTAYTRPWTTRVVQRVMLDTDLIEFICQENEKFSSVPH